MTIVVGTQKCSISKGGPTNLGYPSAWVLTGNKKTLWSLKLPNLILSEIYTYKSFPVGWELCWENLAQNVISLRELSASENKTAYDVLIMAAVSVIHP